MPGKGDKIREFEIAHGFWARFKGWMGKSPDPGTALVIYPCQRVHTCFMRVPIDVVFVGNDERVILIIDCMMPWRISVRVPTAAAVIETVAGGAARAGIKEGEPLPSPLREIFQTIA